MPPPLITPPHGHAVFLEPIKDNPRVKRRPFDGREQLVLRRVGEAPAQANAAQFGIHQHRAVAVVPGEAQQPGRARAVLSRPRDSSATLVPARRAMASNMSPVAESPASMPVYPG